MLSSACFLRSRSARTPGPSKTFYAHESFAFIFSNRAKPFSARREKTVPRCRRRDPRSVHCTSFCIFFLGSSPTPRDVFIETWGCFQEKNKNQKTHLVSNSGRGTERKRCLEMSCHICTCVSPSCLYLSFAVTRFARLAFGHQTAHQ